jgi:serine/threonine protein kinase
MPKASACIGDILSAMTEDWTKEWERRIVNGVYPLRRFLGRSNHSVVFLTECTAQNVPQAAIKILPAHRALAEAQLAHWRRVATLSHPHLMRLHDAGRCQLGGHNFLFVVTDLAEQNLAQILPGRPLTAEEVRDLLPATLDALAYLHGQNLVQGGLKPTNFLVVDDRLKLASDTIRPAGERAANTARPSRYDPPEAKNGGESTAGDIWGLGITLVEALTQTPPAWSRESSDSVSLPDNLAPEFVDTVEQCLNRDPGRRPSIAELAVLFELAPPAAPPPAPTPALIETPPPIATPEPATASATLPTTERPAPRATPPAAVMPPPASTPAPVEAPPAAVMPPPASTPAPVEAPPSAASRPSAIPPPLAVASPSAAARAPTAAPPPPAAPRPSVAPRPPVAPSPPAATPPPIVTPVASEPSASTVSIQIPREKRFLITATAVGIVTLCAVWAVVHLFHTHTEVRPTTSMTRPSPPAVSPPAAAEKPKASSAAPLPSSVLHQEMPEVSHSARGTIRGDIKISVRVIVDRSGNVVATTLDHRASSKYFARAALDAAEKWQFAEATDQTSRVWLLRFEFTRAGTTAHAAALR